MNLGSRHRYPRQVYYLADPQASHRPRGSYSGKWYVASKVADVFEDPGQGNEYPSFSVSPVVYGGRWKIWRTA